MKSILPQELDDLLKANANVQLIDVRTAKERAAFDIGGQWIPLEDIVQNISKVKKDIPVFFYCQKGIRSHLAIQRLQQKSPFKNLINLQGGTDAWQKIFPLDPLPAPPII